MKLNDPFGRVTRRNRHQYQTLRSRLQEAGIDDAAALAGFVRNMTATALKLAAVIVVISAGLALFFPSMLGPLLALDFLILLWLSANYLLMRVQLRRYLREECSAPPRSAGTGGGP